MDFTRRVWPWASVLVAVLLLNGSLTFHNVWPTLGVHWPGEISAEFAALLLILAMTNARFGATPRRAITALSALFVLLALGRYAEVTAPALYGRDVNLYWDLPNITSVVEMLVRVASWWAIAGVCLGAVAALTMMYCIARWSISRIDAVLRERRARIAFGVVGAVLVACFAMQQTSDAIPTVPRFSIPVSKTYSLQVAKVLETFSGSRSVRNLPPSPQLRSSLAELGGSDVLLVFEESYGSVTYDRPEFRQALAPARARLALAIKDTGRDVVSAFATSPTFGGVSWLAHISFLSGIEVRDPDRYALLMTQKRRTIASLFKNAGYRAVAVMPGLRQTWPEGSFYGFDQIYDFNDLNYHGPEFGWWRIPDQFSLAQLDSREIQPAARKPLFVFFPTVSTHMPFRPTPPVQSDWQRVLTSRPFDPAPLHQSLTQTPEWTNMGKSYTDAVQYFFDTVSTYLRARAGEKFVLIILGDHQPAANVSGEGAPWDVPIHVITHNPEILASLRRQGFTAGLDPARPVIGKMNELSPLLLAAFDRPASEGIRLSRASSAELAPGGGSRVAKSAELAR